MARTIVFDVNETLLDLTALDPLFERAFGRSGVRREWFAQLLQSAFVSIITDSYADFGTIGRAALHMVAQRNGIELEAADRDAILGSMRELPPHPEGPPAVARPGMVLDPLAPAPDMVGSNLEEVATRIIEVELP